MLQPLCIRRVTIHKMKLSQYLYVGSCIFLYNVFIIMKMHNMPSASKSNSYLKSYIQLVGKKPSLYSNTILPQRLPTICFIIALFVLDVIFIFKTKTNEQKKVTIHKIIQMFAAEKYWSYVCRAVLCRLEQITCY